MPFIRHIVTGSLAASALLTGLLTGCQTIERTSPETRSQAEPEQRVYMQLYDERQANSRGITLVTKDETLQKAIRHAFPDAPISADGGVDINQSLDIWAEDLTPGAFLDHLGSQANLVIARNDRGGIEIHTTDQWAFSLPDELAADLMPQAQRVASRHGVETVLMGNQQEILLLTGSANSLSKTRRALEQLSDRVRLERTLNPLSSR